MPIKTMNKINWMEKRVMSPGYARFIVGLEVDEISIMLVSTINEHVLVVGNTAYWLHTGKPCDPSTTEDALRVAFGPEDTIILTR